MFGLSLREIVKMYIYQVGRSTILVAAVIIGLAVGAILIGSPQEAMAPSTEGSSMSTEVFIHTACPVVEIFNWDAWGEPWTVTHLGVHQPELYGPEDFGIKMWVELDRAEWIYCWDPATGAYQLLGLVLTVGDPPKLEADQFHVWPEGSFRAGTFVWLGAIDAQEVAARLAAMAATGVEITEDVVKQVASQVAIDLGL